MKGYTDADTPQARWARFRFSIVGPLLSAPPEKGDLLIAPGSPFQKTMATSNPRLHSYI